MVKINVSMYGGKSIFGGREEPYNVDIAYCDKCEDCTFYKNNTCFNAGRWQSNCQIGTKDRITGNTSRSKKGREFYSKWKSDEKYGQLKEPKATVGKVEDTILINMSFIRINDDLTLEMPFNDKLSYISLDKFDNTLIKRICNFSPQAMFGGTITNYAEKVVPNFLGDLKIYLPDIYNRFINEFPEYDTKVNYVGKYVYISSLPDGTELKIDKGNFKKSNGKLICTEYSSAFNPFDAKTVYIEILIDEKMKIKVTDNMDLGNNPVFES